MDAEPTIREKCNDVELCPFCRLNSLKEIPRISSKLHCRGSTSAADPILAKFHNRIKASENLRMLCQLWLLFHICFKTKQYHFCTHFHQLFLFVLKCIFLCFVKSTIHLNITGIFGRVPEGQCFICNSII
jgi:hypothetical protein